MPQLTVLNTRKRALGFSLVEIMVAALIGLIGSMVIFQVFAVSEGQKRTTTGGADAQQAGLLALYSIERDARLAGFGINYATLLGCDIQAYDGGPPVRDPIPTFKLVAARISDGLGGAPDSITFVYGNSDLMVAPVRLITASAAAATVHKVNIRFGFNAGDLILVAQVGSANACTLQEATNLPASPADDVEHTTGNYTNVQGAVVTARYNKPGGFAAPNYATWSNTTQSGGVLYNLGPAPSVVTYVIDVANSQLTQQSVLTSSPPGIPIMGGIIQLQAQYGKDTTGVADGTVDAWDTTEPANADEWSRVIALRIALLARSEQFERTAVTPAAPAWIDGAGNVTAFTMTNVDGTADTNPTGPNNWRNYRYRVFETTVPLRNQIWFAL